MFKFKTLRGEESGLDSGLQVCKELVDDLGDCLNIVERLNRKYNNPVEGTRPLAVHSLASVSKKETKSGSKLRGESVLLQDSEEKETSGPQEARTNQEVRSSYTDIRTKCIKLKRELEGTMSLTKHINDLAYRQPNYNLPVEKSLPIWRI